MASEIRPRMTAREFFELPETNRPTELIDGEVIVSPPPVPRHQDIVLALVFVLRPLIPSGKLYIAPLSVYLDEANIPEPDVMWLAEGSRCEIGEKYLKGAPDLVIEVLSPGSAYCDKVSKFRLYEQHGAREYWMVDPDQRLVEVWRQGEGGFVRQGIFGPGESFESAVLGGKGVDVKAILGE